MPIAGLNLGLTEDNPTISPYEEKLWAELERYASLPTNVSITLLYSLHTRLYELLKHVTDENGSEPLFILPATNKWTLWYLLGMYAWHGRHHTAHITSLRERNGW